MIKCSIISAIVDMTVIQYWAKILSLLWH